MEKLGLTKSDRSPFSDILFEDPDINGSEREVQAKFEDFLEMIRSRVKRSLLTSIPIKNAHNTASFGRRKPDLVNAAIGMTGELAITSFGECQKPGPNDFTDEQVGHILGMAQVYLTKHAFHRHFLIVYLTDGRRWQFFRVQRNGSDLQYQKAPVLNNAMEGWLYFLKLLTAKWAEIGYLEPQVEDTQLIQVLGRGGSSSVYRGLHDNETVVVKIFKKNHEKSFCAEKFALEQLQKNNVAGVPTIKANVKVKNSGDCEAWSEAILFTPKGETLRTFGLSGKLIQGSHLKDLVQIVKAAHDLGLLHRDIKPDNMFLFEKTIFLNDWSSSIKEDDFYNAPWEGSIGYSVTKGEREENRWSGKSCDLIAVVRSSYVLVTRRVLPSENGSNQFGPGKVWEKAFEFAIEEDYDQLGNLLFTLL